MSAAMVIGWVLSVGWRHEGEMGMEGVTASDPGGKARVGSVKGFTFLRQL